MIMLMLMVMGLTAAAGRMIVVTVMMIPAAAGMFTVAMIAVMVLFLVVVLVLMVISVFAATGAGVFLIDFVHPISPLIFFHHMVERHGKDFSDVGIVERIIDHSPLFAALYDAGYLQNPKLVADCAVGHIQQSRKITDAHLLNIQGTDNAGACGVAKHLKKL